MQQLIMDNGGSTRHKTSERSNETKQLDEGGKDNKEKALTFSADEANMFLQLIDDNQMKLNRVRKHHLPQICKEGSDFYSNQLDEMEKDVCCRVFEGF